MAIKLFRYIQNFDKQYDVSFYQWSFNLFCEVWIRNGEQLFFIEKVGLEDGMSRRASEESWQYKNRYDSDNQTTLDSDNDSNVGGCDSDD